MVRKSGYLLPNEVNDWSVLTEAEKQLVGKQFLETKPSEYIFLERMRGKPLPELTRPQRDALDKWVSVVGYTVGEE